MRAGAGLVMTRFGLLPVFIAFTTLFAAAPPPHHAQNQNPRVLGTPVPPPHHAQNQNPRVLGTPAPPPHHAQNQNPRVLGTPVPPPHHAQNQNPRVLGTPVSQAVAPVTPLTLDARSRALHDPHNSLWSQPAPSMYRVRIETTKGIIVLEVTRA